MILKKVGLVSMTKFVTEALDSLSTYSDDPIDFGNSEDLEIGIKKILRFQTSEFWKQEWTTPASDTKAFRDLIENSLKLIQQNILSIAAYTTRLGGELLNHLRHKVALNCWRFSQSSHRSFQLQ